MQISGRKNELDGLRAFAVMPVLISHAWPSLLPGGHLGVDIFFVLSGFLIAGLLLDQIQAGTFSPTDFYRRRSLRLMPAFFVVLYSTILVSWLVHTPSETATTLNTALYAAFSLSNLYLPQTGGYFAADAAINPLLHTWSLGVEEQFYLAFPLVLYVTMRWFRPALTVVMSSLIFASFCYAFSLHESGAASAHYSTFGRTWELLLGAALAALMRNPLIPLAGRFSGATLHGSAWLSISVIAGLYFLDIKHAELWISLAISIATVVLIWTTCDHSHLATRMLRFRWFVWVGLLSYSLYLWHQPVMAFARLFIPASNVAFLAGTITVSVLLATITHRFVEKPARHLKMPLRRIMIILSLSMAMTFAIQTAGQKSAWFANRYSGTPVFEVLRNPDQAAAKNCGLWGLAPDAPIKFCRYETSEKRDSAIPAVALWGDSHAMSLASGFISKDRSYDLVHLGIAGCGIQTNDTWSFPGSDCLRKHSAALDYILKDDSIKIVIFHSRWVVDVKNNELAAALLDNLQEAMSIIKASGRELILVSPIPDHRSSVPDAMLRSYRTGVDLVQSKPLLSHLSDVSRLREPVLGIAADLGAEIITTEELFCPDSECMSHIDGKPLYYDKNHLTAFGARYLVDVIDPIVSKKLNQKSFAKR